MFLKMVSCNKIFDKLNLVLAIFMFFWLIFIGWQFWRYWQQTDSPLKYMPQTAFFSVYVKIDNSQLGQMWQTSLRNFLSYEKIDGDVVEAVFNQAQEGIGVVLLTEEPGDYILIAKIKNSAYLLPLLAKTDLTNHYLLYGQYLFLAGKKDKAGLKDFIKEKLVWATDERLVTAKEQGTGAFKFNNYWGKLDIINNQTRLIIYPLNQLSKDIFNCQNNSIIQKIDPHTFLASNNLSLVFLYDWLMPTKIPLDVINTESDCEEEFLMNISEKQDKEIFFVSRNVDLKLFSLEQSLQQILSFYYPVKEKKYLKDQTEVEELIADSSRIVFEPESQEDFLILKKFTPADSESNYWLGSDKTGNLFFSNSLDLSSEVLLRQNKSDTMSLLKMQNDCLGENKPFLGPYVYLNLDNFEEYLSLDQNIWGAISKNAKNAFFTQHQSAFFICFN